jgi:phosphate transport system substrate-binding protein
VRQVSHPSHAALLAAVAADPGGIALVNLRAPRAGLKTLAIASASGELLPEPAFVLTEDYPLQRRVYLHSGSLIPALARSLAQYAVSPAGQAVVERSMFASFGLKLLPGGKLESMPAEYVSLRGEAQRLPVTLRFSDGLDLFDSRSRQDVDRLLTYLAEPANSKRGVVLMGFANPQRAAPYQSLALSHERVDYVASELRALGIRVVMARGFGGEMPLVEQATPVSDYLNNRVEVWLR